MKDRRQWAQVAVAGRPSCMCSSHVVISVLMTVTASYFYNVLWLRCDEVPHPRCRRGDRYDEGDSWPRSSKKKAGRKGANVSAKTGACFSTNPFTVGAGTEPVYRSFVLLISADAAIAPARPATAVWVGRIFSKEV